MPSKCTCSQRQTQRPNSSPPVQQDSTPPSARPTSATPNKHSSLMQTATLSAYHPSEPQRSPIKSCSLLNENENRLDMSKETYEFVDTTKKASFLTGSARCTLVTATATAAQSPNPHSTNTSRARFGGKLPNRSVFPQLAYSPIVVLFSSFQCGDGQHAFVFDVQYQRLDARQTTSSIDARNASESRFETSVNTVSLLVIVSLLHVHGQQ